MLLHLIWINHIFQYPPAKNSKGWVVFGIFKKGSLNNLQITVFCFYLHLTHSPNFNYNTVSNKAVEMCLHCTAIVWILVRTINIWLITITPQHRSACKKDKPTQESELEKHSLSHLCLVPSGSLSRVQTWCLDREHHLQFVSQVKHSPSFLLGYLRESSSKDLGSLKDNEPTDEVKACGGTEDKQGIKSQTDQSSLKIMLS